MVLNRTSDWQQKFWWMLFRNDNLIRKTEKMEGDVDKNEVFLDKIMARDFSETKVVNDDLKLSVINLSEADGLANFVTKRLERAGFSVISVSSNEGEKLDRCKIVYSDGVEKTFSWRILQSVFNCMGVEDSSLNEGEVEVYLDENFAEVIKYSNYKK